MDLIDCTLRDGANAVGAGFPVKASADIARGLVECAIRYVEAGHALGMGGWRSGRFAPASDEEYLVHLKHIAEDAKIGMFFQPVYGKAGELELAAHHGLGFIRIGTNASEVADAKDSVLQASRLGLEVHFSLMKSHGVSANALAENAKMAESFGAVAIHIMDSAGALLPNQVKQRVAAVKHAVRARVGFHAHNNLGLAVANALAAAEEGTDYLDCSMLGLGRSAGNAQTEALVAVMKKLCYLQSVDLYRLLSLGSHTIAPLVKNAVGIKALDVISGFEGLHSGFLPMLKSIAEREEVDLSDLISEVCAVEKMSPTEELVKSLARNLKHKAIEN